jgi:uncharacterized 2Fe-2S/4Fe-4S cluster protein (DUF4445 family)
MMSDVAESESPECRVRFVNNELTVAVPRGSTILDAARKAGVFIDSLCGGDGVCGKCRVIVHEGKVKGGRAESLTAEEIRQGNVLACETQVDSDLVVEVPVAVSLREQIPEGGRPRRRLYEMATRERQPSKLEPLVKKVHLRVSKPSLENNAADLERLEYALRETLKSDNEYQMGLKVIRTLPDVLRRAEGSVTATVGYRGRLSEITEVTPGDTSARSLGVAVDVGTTTIVAHLVDLAVGQTLESALMYNSQAAYGADVIRRIIWCSSNPGGLGKIHEITVEDINQLIHELEEKFHLSINDIDLVVAVGNTTMMHFLLGINPEWIRREPYCGVTYQPPAFRASEVGLKINARGLLYCLPSVGSFVGADVTAGVLATGMNESDDLRMLIDIGTNGEVVIGNREWLVCASASAGPAFEGAGNRDGMRATHGAIDHIRGWSRSRTFGYSTVGDKPPIGLCGTAYVDLLAELLHMGVMDKTGRFDFSNGSSRLRRGADGTAEYVVVYAGEKGAPRDLVITEDDCSNLIRAKAAIYAAAKLLLRSLGLTFANLKEIMVAGAFGNYLDLENAVLIGLLPDLPAEKLRFAGNTSIAGAKIAMLSCDRYREAQRIAQRMTYFELSTAPSFMEEFSSACFFPHTNIEEFPSVMARFANK